MAIITKPETIYKGQEASFSLSKTELANLPIVSNDPYFQNTSNWLKVVFNFKSSAGNQSKIVEFDATLEDPMGSFYSSSRARDQFQIQSIHIVDFDLQVFIIQRSQLSVADFDIELVSNGSSEDLLLLEDGQSLLSESGESITI
jgi:hypothetical protein